MPRISKTFIVTLLCGFLVTACGGGGSAGGGAGAQASGAATTFPLSTALSSLNATSLQKSLSVSGTKESASSGTKYPFTGTLDFTETPINAGSTFENQAASQQTSTLSGVFNINNISGPFSSTSQTFWSANNLLLGVSSPTSYCVAITPGKYPETITIGDAQLVATYDCYKDSTKAASIGTGKVSFLVGPGNSPNTANFSTIETFMDPAGLQILYTQKNYLIDTSGAISFSSLSFVGLLTSGGAVNDVRLSFKSQ